MLLTEEHRIKRNRHKELFREIDEYCYRVKNLYNAANYLIRQCDRIHRKIREQKELEDWEAEMTGQVNEGIRIYNAGRPQGRQLRYVDENNGLTADAYFLSWYLKTFPEYKAVPYATCSQICIQELCRAWKSYYRAMPAFRKHPDAFTGRPQKPGYLDSREGRGALVITSQNFHPEKDGSIRMPAFLKGIHVRAGHENIRQIRIRTEKDHIRVLLIYETKEEKKETAAPKKAVMGIDLGVDNLITAVWNSDHAPVIINGRTLKSINQYYNKEKARLQAAAKKGNESVSTKRLSRLNARRNRKVRDQLHKASRKIIDLAKESDTGRIIIGNNRGWKQKVDMGKRTNQTFVSIPYRHLIEMIRYKAALEGIEVVVTAESYTSGTSYLDGERPEKTFYNKGRRIHRGLFRSNTGKYINADVNAAYQIMKAGGIEDLKIKEKEKVTRINAA